MSSLIRRSAASLTLNIAGRCTWGEMKDDITVLCQREAREAHGYQGIDWFREPLSSSKKSEPVTALSQADFRRAS
ncbi:hypothetical protein PYCCODRAFT_942902 [Trametes coccinea BRFM310]|uniref:Uncharacterized protein n=1 Tax=Trametes coccinea (strain BRFM310) TaxID=1353009 RepID=A0A1Y2IZM3_TRAC3|nr:hypothetical protein PYCCODRAFT_942902 [Trametes coccinea BRFM310]